MTKLLRSFKAAKGGDTVISHLMTKLKHSERFILSVLPMYVLVGILAHLFSCIWYYIADTDEPTSWINRYNYREEDYRDRYFASLYFIYSSLTTTGYGDIVPYTMLETIWTIAFMCIGVSVHSYIFTSMLGKF